MKLCKICNKIGEFHYGQTKCKECCKIIQNERTRIERAMLEKAKAEGRGSIEYCRRKNNGPVLRIENTNAFKMHQVLTDGILI